MMCVCMYVSITLRNVVVMSRRNVAVTSRRNVANMMRIRTPSIIYTQAYKQQYQRLKPNRGMKYRMEFFLSSVQS